MPAFRPCAVWTGMVTRQVCPGATCPPANRMAFVPAVATRVAAPHEGVKASPAATCKPLFGTPGKAWLKDKPVNGMAALLVMVNVKIPVTGLPVPLMTCGLGSKAMVKVGAGTVTVRLIAAAVALGAWLLLRVTAGLVRAPGVVAVT